MSPRQIALLAACFAANVCATDLLLPGDYHGDEINARDREVWLALVQDAHGRTRLEARPVDVMAVNDPVLDDEVGVSGKRVGAQHDDVLFYLRDLPGVPAGAVATAFSANGEPLSIDLALDRRFQLRQRDAGRLRLVCSAAIDSTRNCALQLSFNRQTQQLATWPANGAASTSQLRLGDDAWPHLRWAGDIDRDGRLDLLIDTSDHYNVSQPTLFLSSRAKPGELVGVAALLRSVGC